ncbi:MAG: M20/M25/M40 family metallo-hydrolase, partial [Bacilli bacterium]|nr:M20/M25/M40 family metallo-hydrolase [Bacilli bacterium]
MILSIGHLAFLIVIILLFILFLVIIYCYINYTINIKKGDKNFKPIPKDNSAEYLNKLFDLIKIKTTSFETDANYHIFREKIKEMFPLVHRYFIKEKLEGNVLLRYKDNIPNAPNILFASHIDYPEYNQNPRIENGELYGDGAFDAKSLLYVMLEAIEKVLQESFSFPCNIIVAITKDDDSTKQGVNGMVEFFLKKGYFFDLVIEEGSGVVDPEFFGLQSHYALIGIGVTGEVTIRFKVPKSGAVRLTGFIHILRKKNIFRSKISNKTAPLLKQIAKDMKPLRRMTVSNLWLFRGKVKKIVDREFSQIAKMLKTELALGTVIETDNSYYIDVIFQLSAHEEAADIIYSLGSYLDRYDIEYQIIDIKDSTRITSV